MNKEKVNHFMQWMIVNFILTGKRAGDYNHDEKFDLSNEFAELEAALQGSELFKSARTDTADIHNRIRDKIISGLEDAAPAEKLKMSLYAHKFNDLEKMLSKND